MVKIPTRSYPRIKIVPKKRPNERLFPAFGGAFPLFGGVRRTGRGRGSLGVTDPRRRLIK